MLKLPARFFAFPTYIALALVTLGSLASTAAGATDVSSERGWLKLLHFEKNMLWGTSSQVAGEAFFLSPDGNTDPEAELKATLAGFAAPVIPGKDEEHALCRFPARYLYLEKHHALGDGHFPQPDCKKYEAFKKRLSAQSATLVFSSFYLNNPSSAFGHSFMRINGKKSNGASGNRDELMDFGINYAAVVTTSNPVLYGVLGMVGGFRGTFTSVPYYYKVREYNDFEARDLWSYDLNLTPDEITMLVAHIWELGPTFYRYYYFTQNCSYHMFTTIEAAAPRLSLTERLPFYVIPSDTMRALMKEPGLVSGISYRPSVRAQFLGRLKTLSGDESTALQKITLERDLTALTGATPTSATLPIASKARVLDTALDYMEFKYPENLLREGTESSKFKQMLLVQRATLGVRSEAYKGEPPSDLMPHVGHGIRRLRLLGGSGTNDGFGQLDFRFALHDLLDTPAGYPNGAQIEFASISARYYRPTNQFELFDLTVFDVTSLSPMTPYLRSSSFRVDLGIHRVRDANCNDCNALSFEAGPGIAWSTGKSDFATFYSFMNFGIAHSSNFILSKWRLGAGPSAGVLLTPGRSIRALISGGYRYLAFSAHPDSYDAGAELRYHFNNRVSLAASGRKYTNEWESTAGALFYW